MSQFSEQKFECAWPSWPLCGLRSLDGLVAAGVPEKESQLAEWSEYRWVDEHFVVQPKPIETVKIDWQIQRQIAKVSKTMHPWRAWRHWFILVELAASVEYAVWCRCFQKVEEFMSMAPMAPVVGDVGDDARSSAPVAAFCFMPLRIGCTKMYQDDPSNIHHVPHWSTLYHCQSLLHLATTSTMSVQCQYNVSTMSVQSTSDILWLTAMCS